MRKFAILFFILFSISNLTGQTAKAFEKAGDKAFKNKDYGAALEYYRNAMEINDNKISTIYKYAEVARLFYAYDYAVSNYKKVYLLLAKGQILKKEYLLVYLTAI